MSREPLGARGWLVTLGATRGSEACVSIGGKTYSNVSLVVGWLEYQEVVMPRAKVVMRRAESVKPRSDNGGVYKLNEFVLFY